VALSRLFSPDHIGQYFGIRWTDGMTTLLTWRGSDTIAPNEEWLATYRQALASSSAHLRFPNVEIKAIYERLNATPHPWQPFAVPWRMR
jgi:hypothetical protein